MDFNWIHTIGLWMSIQSQVYRSHGAGEQSKSCSIVVRSSFGGPLSRSWVRFEGDGRGTAPDCPKSNRSSHGMGPATCVWFQVVLVWFASTSKTRSQVDPSAAPLYLERNVLEHSQIQPVFNITSCFVPNCFQVSNHVPNSFSNFSN